MKTLKISLAMISFLLLGGVVKAQTSGCEKEVKDCIEKNGSGAGEACRRDAWEKSDGGKKDCGGTDKGKDAKDGKDSPDKNSSAANQISNRKSEYSSDEAIG